ncbi:MAG: metalloregulator ArsR/SmtB family transcription factor [Rhizobiaceae bacterium]|nr:metalloregulator ArsR/SmtB family transcription factor [Rhizobiaceae bacterium]
MISAEQGAFRALADPTRRQILMHLSTREMTIAQVCEKFEVTRGAIKKHLVILEEGNLISVRRAGRERINRLHPQGMKSAVDWLQYFSRFWDDKLTNLEIAINSENKSKESHND